MAETEKGQRRVLGLVLGLTGTFGAVEAASGFIARSETLKADALHVAMDVSAIGLALAASFLATRPATARFPFGLARAEPLAALVNGFLVIFGTFVITRSAVLALLGHEVDHDGHDHGPRAGIMMAVAVGALVINGLSAFLLHRGAHAHHAHGHGHGHGHAHTHTHPPKRQPPPARRSRDEAHAHDHDHHHDHAHGEDHDHPKADCEHEHHPEEHEAAALNLRGAFLHVLGDALGGFAALVAGAAIHFGAPPAIDPIASLVVAVLLFLGSLRLIRDASVVLLDGAPPEIGVVHVESAVSKVAGVTAVVSVHAWSLGAGKDAVAVRVRGGGDDLAARVGAALEEHFDLAHVWVHVEGG